ncbi:hypothetical protein CPB84DRAFT_1369514 [Gymnopilus junonius]|uniref:Uncharacterized protein n=1 Tax=Gymnopilus junonius TaxID=109634 RepID=A0A9P5TLA6_GYMJU|nr:hypothetical protein CPB84DRAFT_1369514 [Gymnopilus junonius]
MSQQSSSCAYHHDLHIKANTLILLILNLVLAWWFLDLTSSSISREIAIFKENHSHSTLAWTASCLLRYYKDLLSFFNHNVSHLGMCSGASICLSH